MSKKLILSAIVLLSILSACSDRNEEISTTKKVENNKIEKNQLKLNGRIVNDSLKTNDEINEANPNHSVTDPLETIDPSKPKDKPW